MSDSVDRMLGALVEQGLLAEKHVEVLKNRSSASGARIEEVLIDAGVVEEADLLKALAAFYRTRFVSTEKLKRLRVRQGVLNMLPEQLAHQLMVVPLLMDRKTETLSVATGRSDENAEVEEEVRVASGVRRIRVFLARPAAVTAAIHQNYRDDKYAFDLLDVKSTSTPLEDSTESMSSYNVGSAPVHDDGAIAIPGFQELGQADVPAEHPTETVSTDSASTETAAAAIGALDDDLLSGLSSLGGASKNRETNPAERDSSMGLQGLDVSSPSLSTANAAANATIPPSARQNPVGTDHRTDERWTPLRTLARGLVEEIAAAHGFVDGWVVESERLALEVAKRIGLPLAKCEMVGLAALVRAAGHEGLALPSPLETALSNDAAEKARASFMAPIDRIAPMKPDRELGDLLVSVYERPDGTGFPARRRSDSIPLGARILAVVESYLMLTMTNTTIFGSRISAPEALAVLDSHTGSVLDRDVVGELRAVLTEES